MNALCPVSLSGLMRSRKPFHVSWNDKPRSELSAEAAVGGAGAGVAPVSVKGWRGLFQTRGPARWALSSPWEHSAMSGDTWNFPDQDGEGRTWFLMRGSWKKWQEEEGRLERPAPCSPEVGPVKGTPAPWGLETCPRDGDLGLRNLQRGLRNLVRLTLTSRVSISPLPAPCPNLFVSSMPHNCVVSSVTGYRGRLGSKMGYNTNTSGNYREWDGLRVGPKSISLSEKNIKKRQIQWMDKGDRILRNAF